MDPIRLDDFRSISLIGCYYKIIVKLWVDRLKRLMGKLVGDVQNTFIDGRFILNGITIVNETMSFMRRNKKKVFIFKWIS